MRKINLFLFLILVLAVFLRFFQLGQNPPSLTWDEAAWGYNAYALGIDSKDEFGKFLPITYLESFGDFKPPVYAYLSVLPVKIFGLNEFSTRFASALLGSLTVFLTFLLTKDLFSEGTRKEDRYVKLGLTASFILAISPWHILLSRAAFEANVATFFIVLGVYLFLRAKYIPWLLPLSVISFVISMYTFNTARIVVPILLVGLLIKCIKNFLKFKKQLLASFVIGVAIVVPLLLFLVTPQAKLRFQEVNIFSDINVIERINQETKNDYNSVWSKIIHNRRFAYTVEYLRHYFDNFNPSFLFIKGDGNPKFSVQDVGQMYLWEIPFFIAGIFLLIRKKEGGWWLVFYWLIISIIPAATARETPHALRIESSLPTFQILSAFGLYSFISFLNFRLKNMILKRTAILMLFIIIAFNLFYFLNNYFLHYPRLYSSEWQYGYKDAILYIKQVQTQYDKVYFTNVLGRPYIYLLFYLQYNPQDFRSEANIQREVFGFVHINDFGKYSFPKDVKANRDNRKNLYFDVPYNIPGEAKILKTFYLLNGEISLVAYTI